MIPVSQRTILSLCDYSGEWSKPYREAGYNVMQVDIKHGQDVRTLEHPGKVWGILAAPPCTHLASSGARQAFNDQYPNLPVGGFYNPRVVSVFSGDIEFFCHYDNYASRWDGWTWFFDTVTGRFYN